MIGEMKKSTKNVDGWKMSAAFLIVLVLLVILSGYRKSDFLNSYLEDLNHATSNKFRPDAKAVEFSNGWYRLFVDKSGKIQVTTPDGQQILSDLAYYADYVDSDVTEMLTNVKVWKTADSSITISGLTRPGAFVTISISMSKESPEVMFSIHTMYNDTVRVSREALVADYAIPVAEVYQKNRQIARHKLNREYWLDQQGVKLGEGSRSSMIFNQAGVSSLQLDTKRETVVINLDASFDHPFIQIPLQENGAGKWYDRSASVYTGGNERVNEFSVYFGWVPEFTPRIMLVPGGYIAGYVFTEHADGGNLKTHRAAYFGNESITNLNDATGGFAGHQIAVTKSVFYEDFDEGMGDSLGVNYKHESDYLKFLDQLSLTGSCEICLHTPESSNSNRKDLENAISTVNYRYGSPTWIDHGMYSGNNNRETLVADGLNPESPYYAADLWTRYGIKYFWSPAVEAIRFAKYESSLSDDIKHLRLLHLTGELWRRYKYFRNYLGESAFASFKRVSRGNFPMVELNSLQPMRGTSLPTPLFWRNITIAGSFYSWSTEFVYPGQNAVNNNSWFETEKNELDYLLKNWGVFINHGYFVRTGEKATLIENDKNELITDPDFDKILSYMDQVRDKGDLKITTIRDLLDYWTLTDNVSFDYLSDGSVIVNNNNNEIIKDFSLAINAGKNSVLVDGSKPSSRVYGEDVIIWFDLLPHSSHILKIAY